MRAVLSQAWGATSVAQIECPAGKRIRLLAALGVIAPAADGDIAIIAFTRSTTIVALVATNPMNVAATRLAATLGGKKQVELLEKIDPVTGLVTYKADNTEATVELPNIWWTYTVIISASMTSGSVGAGTLLYELDDN